MYIAAWDYIVATVTFGNPGEEHHKEKALSLKVIFWLAETTQQEDVFCVPLAPPCG